MSIDLKYLIARNRSTLKAFIEKNKLTTYELLLEYCNNRKILSISEDEYKAIVQKEDKKVGKPAEKKPVKRKASTTQKKSTRRSSAKKVKDA